MRNLEEGGVTMPRDFDEPPAERTESCLVAEISARLLEWAELTSDTHVSRWLSTLLVLHRADPAAMWLYVAWQTGDTARIAASFEDRGASSALPRQAVQQATARAFEAMAKVRPDLAKAMREVFEAHAPEARAGSELSA